MIVSQGESSGGFNFKFFDKGRDEGETVVLIQWPLVAWTTPLWFINSELVMQLILTLFIYTFEKLYA